MNRIKLIVILSVFALIGIFLSSSRQFSSEAKGDSILEEIAKYKGWTRVSKEPVKVDLSHLSLSKATLDLSGG